jgi:hypothetical protein
MSSSGESRAVAGSAQCLECVQFPMTDVYQNSEVGDVAFLGDYQLFANVSALE